MTYTDADVRYAVEKVLQVPDRYRIYSQPAAVVGKVYALDGALLARLHELGLPHSGAGAQARYDELDLTNIGISLRLFTPRFAAMRWWPRALELTADGGTARYRISVRAQCFDAAGCSGCAVEVSPVLAEAGAVIEPADRPHVDFYAVVTVRGRNALLPPPIVDLLGLVTGAEWHLLPRALAEQPEFLDRTGLADCRLVSAYLADRARARGVPVRRSFGFFVTAPFSAFHYWTEFEVDGEWIPVDPLLMDNLARWGFLDPARWPPTRSPAGALWRICAQEQDLVRHNGRAARVTLPTIRVG